MRTLCALLGAASAMLAGIAVADENEPVDLSLGVDALARSEADVLEHEIGEGETLSHVAVRYDVTLADLLEWNPGLHPDRVRAGQRVRIDNGLRRVTHTIARGESLSHIALRYEATIEELLSWNPGLDRDRIAAGRALTVLTRVPLSRSESVGSPREGQLVHGRPLPTRHPAFYVRSPARAWATDETVRFIVEGFDAVRTADANAPRVEVHDLSLPRGGPMHGHHSHESGRDADIAYYQYACGELCRFRRIGPDQLDVARQWTLFAHWIANERVEAIFVDHALQRALYEHARARGVPRRELLRIFQYPSPVENRRGLIRHHPRHADHFHVRFRCHETDGACR